MWGVAGLTPLITHMCGSTWLSGRSDPNPEQVFGQAFETLTGLGFAVFVYERACSAASATSASSSGRKRKSIASHTV
jgi:hypothetical protein